MFNSTKYFILSLVCGLCLQSFSQGLDSVDFTHLKLNLELIPQSQSLEGKVELKFNYKKIMDSVFLNGVNMNFKKVMLNSKKVGYRSEKKGIWISLEKANLAKSNSIFIEYDCNPRKGIYFIGWENEKRKNQIWTQGQGIDHRHWIPHRDDQRDKIISEIELTFDAKYEVVSNGSLLDSSLNGKKRHWHYKINKPHSSYLIMLAIGEYRYKDSKSESQVPLRQYYYADREADYPQYYFGNERIFNFLESHIGLPYPWQSYSQVPVQDFRHGGMENTTATIFGDFFLVDSIAKNDRNYSYVNAHELAHQWFGNMVTATGSEHHWLHEGFATYYQWLSEEMLYGTDFFDWMRYKEAKLVFSASMADDYPLAHPKAGSFRFYQKGGWVLYMLHQNLGDDLYRKVIKDYLLTNAYGLVDTESLNKSIKKVVGEGADAFLDLWVYNDGEPELDVKSYLRKDTLFFEITPVAGSLQSFSAYSIPIKVHFQDGSSEESFIRIGDKPHTESILFNKNKKIKYWLVNPNMAILAKIKEEKPFEILQIQFENSSKVLDKYFALLAMEEIDLSTKKEYLEKVLYSPSEFHANRGEALWQLLNLNDRDKLYLLFKEALESGDIQLQKTAMNLMEAKDDKWRELAKTYLNGQSYQLRKDALMASVDWENLTNNQWLKDLDFSKEPGIPGRDVELHVLVLQASIFKSQEALEKIRNRSSDEFDFMTRINAFNMLSSLKDFDKKSLNNYFSALFDYNWKLKKVARSSLKTMYKNPNTKPQLMEYIEENKESWTDFQKRVVNATFDLNIN
tara:strand:- start:3897 stop:6278 length:2382 start_codon:yes stop_codon:yes gene_type:complete